MVRFCLVLAVLGLGVLGWRICFVLVCWVVLGKYISVGS